VSTAIWFAAELFRDRPAGWPLLAAAAAAIAASVGDQGDTVSAQMVWTTPEASPDDRTITVVGTGGVPHLERGDPARHVRSPDRPAAGHTGVRCCPVWRAPGQAFGGQLSRTATNTWTRSVPAVCRGRRPCRER
jgi:hypothetical protein